MIPPTMTTQYNFACAARLATEKRLSERPPHPITDDSPGQVMQEIISRKDAFARGLKHYFTGEPCINGHISMRAVRSHGCMKCHSDDRKRAYHANIDEGRAKQRVFSQKLVAQRAEINAEKKSAFTLAGGFICGNCGEDRDNGLLFREKRSGFRCQICEDYRHHLRTESPLPFSRFEVRWTHIKFNQKLKAEGFARCPQCANVKELGKFHGGWCRLCKNAAKAARNAKNPERRQEQRRRAAEIAGKDYTPNPSMTGKVVSEFGKPYVKVSGAVWFVRPCALLNRFHAQRAELAALDAWQHHIKVRASDAWVSRYFELRGDPWNNPRITVADKYRIRYALDPEFNLRERLRRQITKKRKRDGVSDVMRRAIRTGGESGVIEHLFGYSIAQLKAHLESHFQDGMNWPAFMRGEIHIDHIRPQAAFNLLDDEQYRQCWALSNLRPLWAADNLAKSDYMPCGRRARDTRLAA